VRNDGIEREVEGVLSLEDTGSFRSQQPGGEEFAVVGLIAEADFSPLDRGTFSPLCGVVGRLNPLVIQKREQSVPMLQEALCSLADLVIRAGTILLEAFAHSASDGDRLPYKGISVKMSVLEGVPKGKHSACLGKHPLGESHRIRASAGMFDSFDTPDDVSPTELAHSMVKSLVGRVHVRTEDTLVFVAQDLFEDLGASGCRYMEEGNNRGDKDPKPPPFSLSFPSGLVDVEHRLLRQSLPCSCVGGHQGFRDLLMEFADGPQTDVDAKDRLGDLLAASASHSMQTRQMGKQCSDPGSKT